METLKELWDSVRLNLLDRLGNPLVGAFFVSWLIWNFRLLLVVFGGGEWRPKIDYIDKALMPEWSDWLVHGYIVPLVFALVWVFLLPIIFRRVLVFHRSQVAKTAKAVMVADERIPISDEEANKLRLRIRELTTDWEQERAEYLRQNEELSQRIGTLQKQIPQVGRSPSKVLEITDLFGDGTQDDDEHSVGVQDPHVAYLDTIEKEEAKNPNSLPWPRELGPKNLEQLPSSVANKVRQHKFYPVDIKALLAMRNMSRVDDARLARALGIERFDAKVIIDRLRELGLMAVGAQGVSLNADGRILTAFFKRVFAPPADNAGAQNRSE